MFALMEPVCRRARELLRKAMKFSLNNVQFVMAISVDDPRSQQYYGGQVAAPVFADVMDDVMRIYDIPPDKIDSSMLAGRAN